MIGVPKWPEPPDRPEDFNDQVAVEKWLDEMRAWSAAADERHKQWKRRDRRYGWMWSVSLMVFSGLFFIYSIVWGTWWVAPMHAFNFGLNVHYLRKWQRRQREAILNALMG